MRRRCRGDAEAVRRRCGGDAGRCRAMRRRSRGDAEAMRRGGRGDAAAKQGQQRPSRSQAETKQKPTGDDAVPMLVAMRLQAGQMPPDAGRRDRLTRAGPSCRRTRLLASATSTAKRMTVDRAIVNVSRPVAPQTSCMTTACRDHTACANRPGVMPNCRPNARVRWLWSAKPASAAASAIGRPLASSARASRVRD